MPIYAFNTPFKNSPDASQPIFFIDLNFNGEFKSPIHMKILF